MGRDLAKLRLPSDGESGDWTDVSKAAGKPASSSVAKDWLRALELMAPIVANPKRPLFHVIEVLAKKRADTAAILSTRESFSHGDLVEQAKPRAPIAHSATGLGRAMSWVSCCRMNACSSGR
jgi:hypothetical protein